MPYLDQIVEYINEVVSDALVGEKYATKLFYGITEAAIRNNGDSTESFPVMYSGAGELTYTIPDDSRCLIAYHTLDGLTYDEGEPFGDRVVSSIETANMQMIVYGVKTATGLTPQSFSDIITNALPDTLPSSFVNPLKEFGLQGVVVSLKSVNLNKSQVWEDQFTLNAVNPLRPVDMLMAISYDLIINYNKACYQHCINC